MQTLLYRNVEKLKKYCELGLKGKLSIPVKEISLPLTNVCNNYCIMCQACSEEYENHTYNNEEPFFTTLKEFKKIVPSPPKGIFGKFNKKYYSGG